MAQYGSRQTVRMIFAFLLCAVTATGHSDSITKTKPLVLKHQSTVWSLAFSPDGKLLATASADDDDISKGAIVLWDAQTGKIVRNLQSNLSSISVSFSPDGRALASVSGNWVKSLGVRVWDVRTGKLKQTLIHQSKWQFQCVAFSPDGRTIAAGSGGFEDSAKIILWDSHSGRVKRILTGFTFWGVVSMAFSNNSLWIVGSGGDIDGESGELVVWKVNNGKLRARKYKAWADPVRNIPHLGSIAWGNHILSFRNGRLGRMRPILSFSASKDVTDTVYSPKGDQFVTTSRDDGKLIVWDTKSRRSRVVLQTVGSPIMTSTFSPNGKTLATGDTAHSAKLWKLVGR